MGKKQYFIIIKTKVDIHDLVSPLFETSIFFLQKTIAAVFSRLLVLILLQNPIFGWSLLLPKTCQNNNFAGVQTKTPLCLSEIMGRLSRSLQQHKFFFVTLCSGL